MKKLAYGILALVVLLIVAVIAVPFLVPAERIKTELMIAANDATGRTLSIDGDLGVSVFPVLGLTASKVSFSNAPNSDTANMATIENLVIELNLIPLLSGQVSVDKFILDTPVIVLEVDKAGKKNWEFETAQKAPAATESKDFRKEKGSKALADAPHPTLAWGSKRGDEWGGSHSKWEDCGGGGVERGSGYLHGRTSHRRER